MADKLVIDGTSRGFQITWLCEETDLGATLGDTTYTAADLDREGDCDHAAASLACDEVALPLVARELAEHEKFTGWIFYNQSDARKALKAANAALKALRARQKQKEPWPLWALTAKAAGWVAPKGWKP